MKKTLLLLLLFCGYFCAAQNYQCLQPDVKRYFTNGNGYLRGIRIDSVTTLGDTTIYYSYHTPRGIYNVGSTSTLDSTGGSWLGKRVLQLNDGTFVFDNEWSDSVIIKTQAVIGDAWVFYRDTSTLYYRANVVSIDTMTVSGSLDTVKTIEINAYNGTALVSTDPVNGFQILLTKNHGFLQVFDLYTFPYHLANAPHVQGLDYFLDKSTIDIDEISAGNTIFRMCDYLSPSLAYLYQWHDGDVYEYISCNTYNFPEYSTPCDPPQNYTMDTVVSVTTVGAGVQYNTSGWAGHITNADEVPVYAISPYSGTDTRDSTAFIDGDKMPEEYGQQYLLYYFPNDSSYCDIGPLYTTVESDIAGIQYSIPFEWTDPVASYKAPLGLVYSFDTWAGGTDLNDVDEKKLIYYNRSGMICNSIVTPPDAITNINKLSNTISIFPNPASNELTITTTGKVTNVVINNLIGQVVQTGKYNAGEVTIDISSLPGGIYLVKINDVAARKFVKE